jgi:hypothetical protein
MNAKRLAVSASSSRSIEDRGYLKGTDQDGVRHLHINVLDDIPSLTLRPGCLMTSAFGIPISSKDYYRQQSRALGQSLCRDS